MESIQIPTIFHNSSTYKTYRTQKKRDWANYPKNVNLPPDIKKSFQKSYSCKLCPRMFEYFNTQDDPKDLQIDRCFLTKSILDKFQIWPPNS